MELGSAIRSARLEAGMSQKALAEGLITRNMLSLIEHGSALPSLPTLQALADRLKKPVGYFFGENTGEGNGRDVVDQAWKAYRRGELQQAERLLESGKAFWEDVPLLKARILTDQARKALEEGRVPYARVLLQQAAEVPDPSLKRQILLLQGRLGNRPAADLVSGLPSLDEELLLRARAAMEVGQPDRAARLLDAAEHRETGDWAMLRGKACLMEKDYRSAARYFHQAEKTFPRETAPYLEQCYRELEDFKQAYFNACKQK